MNLAPINEERVILVVVGGGSSALSSLSCKLASLRGLELICFMDSIDREGNIIGGLVCVRDTQLFPMEEALLAEAIPPLRFELTRRYQDEPPFTFYSSKEDNRDRNEMWKRSLRIANQGSKIKGKKR